MADWSNDQIELLKRCWDNGFSATDIIKKLDYAFSRSAILGKVNRLNLKPRRAAYGKGEISVRQPHHKPVDRRPPPPKVIGNTASKPLPPAPPPPPVTTPIKAKRIRNRLPKEFYNNEFFANWIANLVPRLRAIYRIPKDKHCKFILGEVANITSYWCDKATDGGSWCPYHKKLVFVPSEQRRRLR